MKVEIYRGCHLVRSTFVLIQTTDLFPKSIILLKHFQNQWQVMVSKSFSRSLKHFSGVQTETEIHFITCTQKCMEHCTKHILAPLAVYTSIISGGDKKRIPREIPFYAIISNKSSWWHFRSFCIDIAQMQATQYKGEQTDRRTYGGNSISVKNERKIWIDVQKNQRCESSTNILAILLQINSIILQNIGF